MRDREVVMISIAAFQHKEWQELLKLPPNSNCKEKEKCIHQILQSKRVTSNREFFEVTLEEIKQKTAGQLTISENVKEMSI